MKLAFDQLLSIEISEGLVAVIVVVSGFNMMRKRDVFPLRPRVCKQRVGKTSARYVENNNERRPCGRPGKRISNSFPVQRQQLRL